MRVTLPALLLLLCSTDLWAVTYRYASSSNRIYVENGGTTTLTQIRASTPSLPASALTRSGNTWTLNVELRIEDGVRLVLHGSTVGGDVDELRLKSDSGGEVNLWAEYGTIDIEATRIRSWNASAGTVDTNHSDGRAHIRVRSFLGSDGIARESRMDIVDSEISYLGYNAAESYGLVWKVVGSPGSNFELYDKVNVYGDIFGSNIHHNYFGMYTFGHEGGQWVGNQMHHNVQYGFDPHDDSDHLLIEDNEVYENGNHGIIASKRCNDVTIRNNRSYDNAGNGIMIHRSSDDALVEGNESYLNEDSGVALFASKRSIVRNNTLLDNGNAGVRLSMGQSDSRIDDNEIGFSGKYGLYFYRGSDTPEPGDDGRPKGNSFTGNTLHDTATHAIKLSDGDNNTFTSNVITRSGSATLILENATKTRLNKNTLPSGTVVDLQGSSSRANDLDVYNTPVLKVTLDDFSTARFRDMSRKVFDPDEPLYTTASPTSSLLTLTGANTGGSSTVTTRTFTATPASGKVYVSPTAWGGHTGTKSWNVRSPSSGSVSIAYSVGNLAAGAQYDVRRGSTLVGTFTAGSDGKIAFSHAPGSTSTVGYTVTPR
jgi:parallel beta-helix repeat protein